MAVTIRRGQALTALNITPLIDIVFLLLVFFLVSTRFEEESDRGLEIDLPSARDAQPLTATPRELVVEVDSAGQRYLAGQPVDEAELDERLRRLAVDNPLNQSVVIRPDRGATVQPLIDVMNICLKYGLPYSIPTEDDGPFEDER